MLEKLERMNSLLESTKKDSNNSGDSVSLISTHVARARTQSSRLTQQTQKKSPLQIKKKVITKSYEDLLKGLFKAKCNDLRLANNQENWEAFLNGFINKNKK